jgi:hypothetical protein
MSETALLQVGTLSLRPEGEDWNAYYVFADSEVTPLRLASIKLVLVDSEYLKEQFKTLMINAVTYMLEESCGYRPTVTRV